LHLNMRSSTLSNTVWRSLINILKTMWNRNSLSSRGLTFFLFSVLVSIRHHVQNLAIGCSSGGCAWNVHLEMSSLQVSMFVDIYRSHGS
jgi:hypothetical protein